MIESTTPLQRRAPNKRVRSTSSEKDAIFQWHVRRDLSLRVLRRSSAENDAGGEDCALHDRVRSRMVTRFHGKAVIFLFIFW